ncbi:Bin3-domain-containing protein [Stereum hirsutum FP-91666 SS1]|uniref:Bin3-domain-containing protein n=1 Tax=Stereum hirsutum (strain FP-91666) TaxID=721885 RepID=UPI000440A6FE|nr:Bin3-domain-containing protein [Stereum hirsutum FP-91666 SS1]EIM87937.1 Bin3-domain-containing protein [Stereum hirsutum FP-91666 SS1]
MTSVSSTIPTHGNYHNYHRYQNKLTTTSDTRLSLLPSSLFTNARVLDIGCNEGWVSCELAQKWSARRVIGVDIDGDLVRKAWMRRRTIWSRQSPLSPATVLSTPQADYFPASCLHMFGPLPIPPSVLPRDHEFPHNVSFRHSDWPAQPIPEDTEGYDVVIAFSITKWIHLNTGDAGLERFFRRVYTALRQGGTFVLEPQGWESYAKARKLDPVQNAKNLKLRPDSFGALLTQIGFSEGKTVGEVGEGRTSFPSPQTCHLLCERMFILLFHRVQTAN